MVLAFFTDPRVRGVGRRVEQHNLMGYTFLSSFSDGNVKDVQIVRGILSVWSGQRERPQKATQLNKKRGKFIASYFIVSLLQPFQRCLIEMENPRRSNWLDIKTISYGTATECGKFLGISSVLHDLEGTSYSDPVTDSANNYCGYSWINNICLNIVLSICRVLSYNPSNVLSTKAWYSYGNWGLKWGNRWPTNKTLNIGGRRVSKRDS